MGDGVRERRRGWWKLKSVAMSTDVLPTCFFLKHWLYGLLRVMTWGHVLHYDCLLAAPLMVRHKDECTGSGI
jgi:hypothetical protein